MAKRTYDRSPRSEDESREAKLTTSELLAIFPDSEPWEVRRMLRRIDRRARELLSLNDPMCFTAALSGLYKKAQMVEMARKRAEPGRKIAAALRKHAELERLGIDPLSPEYARKQAGLGAAVALQTAIEHGDSVGMAAASKLILEAAGVMAPQKHEHLLGVATPAEAARLVREAFGEKAATPAPNGNPEPGKP